MSFFLIAVIAFVYFARIVYFDAMSDTVSVSSVVRYGIVTLMMGYSAVGLWRQYRKLSHRQ